MATLAGDYVKPVARDDRFFLYTSVAMALTIVAGFGLQLVAGRSSFNAPPIVHAHAIVFMGWVVLYLAQNVFVARRARTLHRWLGWIGAGWMVAMVVLGTIVTVRLVRMGDAPFFFTPLKFLLLDPLSVLTFAGLTTAAIVYRRQPAWHARLHYCGMSLLLGPAFGRLIPMPLLIPYAYEATFVTVLIFPAIGVFRDLRHRGAVHPAWFWGLGVIIGSTLLVEALTYSAVGPMLYRGVTAGSPGAQVDPSVYPPWPGAHLIK
ncbi:hypothetical protein [Sphingomonas sp. GB1N7]|uniref:hypothetical protein n=1 Tax=Parasphingomonas caseinilytica TaxID=3096158 RepID=UPI002FCA4EAF